MFGEFQSPIRQRKLYSLFTVAREDETIAALVRMDAPPAICGLIELWLDYDRQIALYLGIFIDGTMAANVVNGRWVALQVPPGHHIIKPKDNQSGAEVDMEPGKEYYFKTSWGEPGMFHGAHKLLVPVMKEEATYEIKQLKPLDKEDIAWPGEKPAASPKP